MTLLELLAQGRISVRQSDIFGRMEICRKEGLVFDEKAVKRGLEAILFVWGSPVDPGDAAGVFGVSASEIVRFLEELSGEYESRGSGLMIRRIDGSYQICTRPECEEAVRSFCTPVKTKKLSGAALEALAVIAYRQPVSRVQIDEIRGVKSERERSKAC